MANYFTIDGGTTNTRVSLVQENQVLGTIKIHAGAKAGIEDKNLLPAKIKEAITQLYAEHCMEEKDITRILASGMITSEFGLYTLPHTTVPAGLHDLHQVMEEVSLPEISPIPFVFMRGVKTEADMMRGEETELMGLMQAADIECLYVLPGSHSKLIAVNEEGKITDFSTMLTGEMVAALSQNTILKDAVDFSVKKADVPALLAGYDCCEEMGINHALFKVRIWKNLFGKTKEEVYSFFMGVVLHDEIAQILKSSAKKVVLGGQKQLRFAMQEILCVKCKKEIVCLEDSVVAAATETGMIRIYESEGECNG